MRSVSELAGWVVDRVWLPSGIAVCVLGTTISVGAQQPASPLQQPPLDPETVSPTPAPAQSQQPTEQAPAVAPAADQTQLPPIVVSASRQKPKPKPKPGAQSAQRTAQPADAPTAAQAALGAKMSAFDQARENLLPKIGATTYTISREAILDMPQGDNTPIDKVILQMPGRILQFSRLQSQLPRPKRVRQRPIPDQRRRHSRGGFGLGPLIDTNFIASMSLLTGTLPAQYGLRTAGVLDITSRSYATPGGEVSLYGGSRETFTPSFDYGGSVGNTQYFVTAPRQLECSRHRKSDTPDSTPCTITPIRASSSAMSSTLLNKSTRFSFISGAVLQRVPDTQQPQSDAARRLRADQLQFFVAQRK